MSETTMQEFWVAQGVDRLDEHLGSSIADFLFKVSTENSHGSLLAVEVSFHAKGGPARHIQFDQEEWFYVLEGEYVFEIGQERFRLKPGDSALALAKCPTSGHSWGMELEEFYLSLRQPVRWRRFSGQSARRPRGRRWIRTSIVPTEWSWSGRR